MVMTELALKGKTSLKMKIERNSMNSVYYFAVAILYIGFLLFRASTLQYFLGISATLWFDIIRIVCIILFLVKIVTLKMSIIQLLSICIIGLIFLIAAINSGDIVLLLSFLLIVASKNVNDRKVFEIVLKVHIVIIPILISLALLGTIENVMISRAALGISRLALGFTHPNGLGAQLVLVCMCWVILRWEKLKFIDYLLISLIGIFILVIADSRTSTFVIMLLILLSVILKLLARVGKEKILYTVMWCICLLVPILSIYFITQYDPSNNTHLFLDFMFSRRLQFSNRLYDVYGFSFIGRDTPLLSGDYGIRRIPLDNMFVFVAIRYGIITLLTILMGFYFTLGKMIKEKYYPGIICMFLYLLFATVEILPFDINRNITLLLIGCFLYNKNFLSKERIS